MGKTSIGLTPLKGGVVVDIYDDGEVPIYFGAGKNKTRFYTISDVELNSPHARDGKRTHPGIRPRWGIVVGLSDEAIAQTSLALGDKVLCDTNKWTPGFIYDASRKKAWWIKHTDILLVDEEGLHPEEREHIEARKKS